MNYLAVKELNQTRVLRELLKKEREIIVTKDGQPFALMIGIDPESVEESLHEVRRAMFSSAVSREHFNSSSTCVTSMTPGRRTLTRERSVCLAAEIAM